jgi:hypothetical protein
VVWILLAIAFFTSISGKPVDGVLMLIVAVGLAWDAGRRALRHPEAEDAPVPSRTAARPGGRRRFVVIALLTGGVVFAGVVGSFSRYSWPATAGILGLGTVVVLIGWHGPVRARRRRTAAGGHSRLGRAVTGCLWERTHCSSSHR